MAHFLRNKRPLLNEQGQLAEAGYSTSPVPEYDRRDIKAHSLRIKEWDSYVISDGKRALILTVADHSHTGITCISYIDFEEKWEITKTPTVFFPMGKTNLPSSPEYGDLRISKKGYELCFENHGNNRILTFRMERFKGSKAISGRLLLTCPKGDTAVAAVAFPRAPKDFFYNQNIPYMPAEGTVTLGESSYTFSKASASAALDWGRAVLPLRMSRHWASASGKVNGQPFALNFGPESMVFYNGQAHLLEAVTLKKNQFRDPEGRVALEFTPLFTHTPYQYRSCRFGTLSGTVVLTDGTLLQIEDAFGFLEKTFYKW